MLLNVILKAHRSVIMLSHNKSWAILFDPKYMTKAVNMVILNKIFK